MNWANKGRFGDTKIRNVDGPSHVNAYEAFLIDKYGAAGRNQVEQMGAGTINPATGLKEYHENTKKVWEKGWHPHPHWNQLSSRELLGRSLPAGWVSAIEDEYFPEDPPPYQNISSVQMEGQTLTAEELFQKMDIGNPGGYQALLDAYDIPQENRTGAYFPMTSYGGYQQPSTGKSLQDWDAEKALGEKKIGQDYTTNIGKTQFGVGTGIGKIRGTEKTRLQQSGLESGGQAIGASMQNQLDKLFSGARQDITAYGGERETSITGLEADVEASKQRMYEDYYAQFIQNVNTIKNT